MDIQLGKVIKPQGIKGELKILPISNADFFKSIELVRVNGIECKIQSVSVREGFVYLKLDICNDRNQAETLRDSIITAPKEVLPDLAEGQFFYDDLIGCQVYLDNGDFVGEITDIENYGNADIFDITKDFSTTLCPYLKDIFTNIDTHNKKIIANTKRYKEVTEYED